jgi:hypothetical protein
MPSVEQKVVGRAIGTNGAAFASLLWRDDMQTNVHVRNEREQIGHSQ